MSADFKLSPQERNDPLWRRMHAHLEARLATLRAQNDTTTTTEQTEKLRGRIFEVKALLSLDDERRPLPDKDPAAGR